MPPRAVWPSAELLRREVLVAECAGARWRWAPVLWPVGFTPIVLGLAFGGLLGPWRFLLVAVCWGATLACVLRMETVPRARSPARDALAAAGWALAALLLITGGALIASTS